MSHGPGDAGGADEVSGAGVAGAGEQDARHGEAPARTGDVDVDTALERLAELDTRPTAEHVDVFEDVHGRLQRILSDLDGE